MRLDFVELENFRLYHGRQRLNFSKHQDKHVTIIHGVNGVGKTSLFLAINWCLYGREILDNIGELISRKALEEAGIGQLVTGSVKVGFSHSDYRYVMSRQVGSVRQTDGTIAPYQEEVVDLRRVGADGQARRESNPLTVINAILPANVRTYFLFDGEKISEFAKPEAAKEVKLAIDLVLRLETLDRAKKHLKSMMQKYRKDSAALSDNDELKRLQKEAEKKEATQEKTEKRLAEIEVEIGNARKQVAEIDQLLSGMKEVQGLQKERLATEKNIKTQRKRLENHVEAIQEKATEGYRVLARPIMEKALAILDEKRAKGQIPSNIRQQFVQDLLNQLMCICGRPISEHTTEYERLTGLLAESVPSSLEEAVLKANDQLRGLVVDSQNHEVKIQELMQERANTQSGIRQLEGTLQDLEAQLKDAPLEDAAALEVKRKATNEDIERLLLDKGRVSEQTKVLKKEIAALNTQIRQAKKTSKRVKHLQRKMDLAQQSAQAIEETYQKFADEMRLKIEHDTNQIFHSLVWKTDHFQGIRLGTDYNLEVLDRYGRSMRPELSAGERQVLSLSFIAAMARASGEEAPLVMDTPFGRLSSDHRLNITKNLPQFASQLILLITDEEMRDEARTNLKAYIGAEYRLEFDDASSCTTIVEVR